MKNLELEQMEELQGGCGSHDLVKSMLFGAAWGGLFGGPVGLFVGMYGSAAACLLMR